MDPTEFKVKDDVDLETLSRLVWRLDGYKTTLFDKSRKLRARLFYESDDLPKDLWILRLPDDDYESAEWINHLVLNHHNGRVGVAEFDDTENDDTFDGLVLWAIFEDPNDMLLFRLSIP